MPVTSTFSVHALGTPVLVPGDDLAGALEGEVDRLLTEGGHAGVDGGLEVDGVGVGGGGDEHGVDAVDRLIDRRGGLRAVLARDRGGSVRGGVVDGHELHLGVLGEVTGMDGPDEPGTEEGKTLHRWVSFRRFV